VSSSAILEAKGLSKTFASTRVLHNVDLTISHGEVVALLGENGSGKSTLIKILGGVYSPDPGGELRVGGRDVELPVPAGEAQRLGLSFVHQDLGLALDLTVLENLQAAQRGQVRGRDRLWIRWRSEREQARRLLAGYELQLDPDAVVQQLTSVERAMLATVRAVEALSAAQTQTESSGLLVLDEPTAFLGGRETQQLFDLIRRVAKQGAGVVLVTHYIADVRAVADRVVVLRDGCVRGVAGTDEVDDVALVELIIGEPAAEQREAGRRRSVGTTSHAEHAQPALAVEHLSDSAVEDVSFLVYSGEVLGIAGVRGSGFERVPYLITGARRAHDGAIVVADRRWEARKIKPRDAVASGVALVPSDRGLAGGAMDLTVAENIGHFEMPRLFRAGHGVLKQRDLDALANSRTIDFDIRPRDPRKPLSLLSGGNQQKVVLAKWLEFSPQVLLLHDPTQGVDVGARQAIYDLIAGAVERGAAVAWFSNDYEELAHECGRVLVMDRGRIADELTGQELSEDALRRSVYRAALQGSRATGGVHV
jgi:ribose transport system ATP-binding protein